MSGMSAQVYRSSITIFTKQHRRTVQIEPLPVQFIFLDNPLLEQIVFRDYKC